MKEKVLAAMGAVLFLLEMTKILSAQLLDLTKTLIEHYHEFMKMAL